MTMSNSDARKRVLDAGSDAGLDPDLLEIEARLRNELRDLGAHDPIRLSVGLARQVYDWIQAGPDLTPDEVRNLAPSAVPAPWNDYDGPDAVEVTPGDGTALGGLLEHFGLTGTYRIPGGAHVSAGHLDGSTCEGGPR